MLNGGRRFQMRGSGKWEKVLHRSQTISLHRPNQSITSGGADGWTEPRDDKFKQVVAEVVTNFCGRSEGCAHQTRYL
ncbi:hypothetical protein AC249_AIPGENE25330 [Exaiptasia diaphana]|nr:hypothetical protein AC249_AIPGENE25330 [Exaiptasia diaphana]